MKAILHYIIMFLLPLTLITGCETEAKDVEVPEFDQKLVIAGFVSPSDTVSYINVRSNWGIYGHVNTSLPVGILSGTISDGVNEISLDTCKKGLKFNHRKMKIEYGKTYTVSISNDKGMTVEAICKVPEKKVFSIDADTISVKMAHDWSPAGRRTEIRVSFADIPGEENFYRLAAVVKGYNKYYEPEWHSQELQIEDCFISDRKLDGKMLVRETSSGMEYFMSDSTYVVVYLYHTEKSYYQYHKSLIDYNDMDGPFSEPTPVYSNIKNGLGIFTSYTVDSAVFRLK